MRVLHVHRISGIGGSERHLLVLLPALRAHGIEATFAGLDDPDGRPEPFYEALSEAGVPFVRVRSPRDLDPALAVRLVRAARPFRPELLHTHLVHADVYGAAASLALRVPLVSTKHNDDPFRAGRFRQLEQLIVRRCSRVIAITESLRRFNVERVGLPAAKLTVVRYGLDEVPRAWSENPELRVRDGAPLLLAVSRLVPQKGIDVAIRALPAIRERHPEAMLVVAGEGPERERLTALARSLRVADGLKLPGRAGDVEALLRRATMLVHPARWEGFGLVLLEAMLAGLPIVASRVSAIPEVVVDGATGLLVEPDQPGELAAAVVALLDDEALGQALGQAGLERARAEFSVARMTRETAAVYADALRTTASAHDSTV